MGLLRAPVSAARCSDTSSWQDSSLWHALSTRERERDAKEDVLLLRHKERGSACVTPSWPRHLPSCRKPEASNLEVMSPDLAYPCRCQDIDHCALPPSTGLALLYLSSPESSVCAPEKEDSVRGAGGVPQGDGWCSGGQYRGVSHRKAAHMHLRLTPPSLRAL